MTGAKPRRLPAAQRREVVLAAATEIVAREGYSGATVRKVAEAAGVTPPIIYDHFGSKEALLVELMRAGAEQLIAAVSENFEADNPEEFLRASIEAFFGFVEDHPHVWRMLFRDPPPHPEVAAAHAQVMEDAARALQSLFALTPRWRTSARLRDADRLAALAAATRSAINGLAGWWWENRHVPRRQVVALATDLLWTGLERLREVPADHGHGVD